MDYKTNKLLNLKPLALLGLVIIFLTLALNPAVFTGIKSQILVEETRNKPHVEPMEESSSESIGSKEDENYENDFTLKTISGKSVKLRALKGKIVFMNLWASWCPPCVKEMQSIQKLYDKVDKSKVAFVMLSLDEDQQKGRKFIQENNYSFPVYFPIDDLPEFLRPSAIPTTFILGKDGRILDRYEGMADFNTKEFLTSLNSFIN